MFWLMNFLSDVLIEFKVANLQLWLNDVHSVYCGVVIMFWFYKFGFKVFFLLLWGRERGAVEGGGGLMV